MAQKLIPWNTGGGNIIVNYSGSGNDTVTVGSDTDNPSFNPRSQDITVHTTAGASISRVVTITQSGKTVPVGTIYNFAYTGTVQSQELPAGTYKLQCWGAQGGSNPADSTYGIISVAGGKGGYSEGILTLTSPTTLYIFVGGQPSTNSNNGGWNGGGGGIGSSSNGTDTGSAGLGISRMGRGGGGTDIALTTSTMNYSSYRTNRSSASLLSRFIVAGGGSGGAMALKRKTSSTTSWTTIGTIDGTAALNSKGTINGHTYTVVRKETANGIAYFRIQFNNGDNPFNVGDKLKITFSDTSASVSNRFYSYINGTQTAITDTATNNNELTWDYTVPSGGALRFQIWKTSPYYSGTITFEKEVTTTTTTDTYESQIGYVGGGVEGGGYSSSWSGSQDAAGNAAGFGYGAGVSGTAYRYTSARGGGGWYGGGNGQTNQDNLGYITRSGGGSGFVNIAANAQYRPSGYTGIELNSGSTYDGTQSFEAVNGGTETGHDGNGYARITRVS